MLLNRRILPDSGVVTHEKNANMSAVFLKISLLIARIFCQYKQLEEG